MSRSLIADGPADAYSGVFLTLRSVVLEPGRVELFRDDDGVEMNLLDFRDEDFVLTVDDAVPAGRYERIILDVASVRTEGGPCDSLDIKIPSGRIHLNPRGPFDVVAGESLSLRLDIDANKSIQLKPPARPGKCIFRPVVFVDVERDGPPRRCPRSFLGEVVELRTDDAGATVGFDLELGRSSRSLTVLLDDETTIFDGEGAVAGASALAAGQTVRVRGQFDRDRRLVAAVVIIGDVLVVDGEVDGELVDDRFSLDADAGEAVLGSIDVALSDATVFVGDCNQAVDRDDLVDGHRVRVLGKLDDGDLNALLVVVRRVRDEWWLFAVEAVDGAARVTLRPSADESTDETERTVPFDGLLLEGDGGLGVDLLRSILECRPLRVHVTPDPDDDARLLEVRAEAGDIDGEVLDPDADARTFALGETSVHVPTGATILDTRGGVQTPASFTDLVAGVQVRVFGLSLCEGDVADFRGSVVLITDDD